MKFKLSAYTIYELGQRKRQEDSIFPQHNATQADDRLFIVCDGMGGHSGGNIASAAVCEAMSSTLLSICPDAEGHFSDDDLRQALEAAYDSLDAKDDGSEKKMGTTMTLLKFHDAGCTIAHIGDSRVYHVRPGADAASTEILFQTQDHSLVNDLVRIGELTPEEAKTSKQRNIITRAMQPNMGRRSRADIYHTTDILPGDYFMLCTDGILEQMEDDNIKYIFSDKVGDAQQKVDMIVKVTEDNSDNHSAILVKVTDVKGAPVVATPEVELHETIESAEEEHESKSRRTKLIYLSVMLAIVVGTILFLTLRSSEDQPANVADKRNHMSNESVHHGRGPKKNDYYYYEEYYYEYRSNNVDGAHTSNKDVIDGSLNDDLAKDKTSIIDVIAGVIDSNDANFENFYTDYTAYIEDSDLYKDLWEGISDYDKIVYEVSLNLEHQSYCRILHDTEVSQREKVINSILEEFNSDDKINSVAVQIIEKAKEKFDIDVELDDAKKSAEGVVETCKQYIRYLQTL